MLAAGTMLENYEIVRLVAVGGMCHVYEAHNAHGSSVAVKVLQRGWADDEQTSRRFLNEANVLREIRHPHIVTLVGTGTTANGEPYMLLEWLPFQLVDVLAEQPQPLPVAHVIRTAAQVAGALEVLHDRQIVHRDIKAANILLDTVDLAQARSRLADLGLAKVLPDIQKTDPSFAHVSTGGTTLLGTFDYMAPEQWVKSKTVDAKADVYGLGVLLFQLISGRLPFVANDAKDLMALHLFEQPPLKVFSDEVPRDLRDLVAEMLHKLPKSRPTMKSVRERLDAMHERTG